MKHQPASLTALLVSVLASACAFGAGGDASATETAIAAKVMTQIAATAAPALTPAPPASGAPPETAGPQPPFNPFENLTAEQETCLRQAWGDETFQTITTFQRPPTPEEAPAMQTCGLLQPPAAGTGAAPSSSPTDQSAATRDEVYFTTSSDGLNWAEPERLAEEASVPDVLRTAQGVFWAYWVDFTTFVGPNSEKIGVARSTDGVDWEKLGTVNFADADGLAPVDPNVVELPDGRLRLYFYDITQVQGRHSIYSAVSTDGVNYTVEAGARFSLEGIFDPDVTRLPDGRYRMYLNNGGPIASATSADGLTFTQDDGLRLEQGGVPGAIVLADGSVRLYACSMSPGKALAVHTSDDGLTFTLEKDGLVTMPAGAVCDPAVTETPTGYLMVFKFNPAH